MTVRTAAPCDANLTKRAAACIDVGQAPCLMAINAELMNAGKLAVMNAAARKIASLRNGEIARIFEQIADLLEIDGANPFRVRAYRNAARMLSS